MNTEVIEMPRREAAGIVATQTTQYSAIEIRQRVNLIQEVMQKVMIKDTHYGVIPGTKKPSLYKPGAEVLCVTFRIADKYEIEDLSADGIARFRVRCVGVHQVTGDILGEGVGECSSHEEKYKWRGAICQEEFDITPENMRRIKFSQWQGKVDKKQQVRTEPSDQANTVLKMACKRAKIAMTLNVTAASDIFTQDIEDIPAELRSDGVEAPAGDPLLAAKWMAKVAGCDNADELALIWKAGLAEIKAANDMTTYNAFKSAVEAHGKKLKGETA
jgi:hypothetical protein